MGGAKALDALARMPGMSGENADAVAAYTQADLQTAWKQLGMKEDDYPETWITLPRNRWPKDGSWDHIADPVCEI